MYLKKFGIFNLDKNILLIGKYKINTEEIFKIIRYYDIFLSPHYAAAKYLFSEFFLAYKGHK